MEVKTIITMILIFGVCLGGFFYSLYRSSKED